MIDRVKSYDPKKADDSYFYVHDRAQSFCGGAEAKWLDYAESDVPKVLAVCITFVLQWYLFSDMIS